MATTEQILEILVGRKVFDEAGFWRVYDSNGTELTTLSAAQWHGGTHGAILWGQPAGTYGNANGFWPRLLRLRRR